MQEENYFVDFDGVIFDTEKRIQKLKLEYLNLSWNDLFEQINWYQFINESNVINGALDYLLAAQKLKKTIYILTKAHTLSEMKAKVDVLRERNLYFPVLLVPPHVKKSEIYVPKNGEILIDDSQKNLIAWKKDGGTGIYFNEDLSVKNSEFETVNSLKRILRG